MGITITPAAMQVVNMGYAPTGGTLRVQKPVVPPKEAAPRTSVSIKGVDNRTVLSYSDNVGIKLAWRFLLNPEGKIFFVGIDLLASPQELLSQG